MNSNFDNPDPRELAAVEMEIKNKLAAYAEDLFNSINQEKGSLGSQEKEWLINVPEAVEDIYNKFPIITEILGGMHITDPSLGLGYDNFFSNEPEQDIERVMSILGDHHKLIFQSNLLILRAEVLRHGDEYADTADKTLERTFAHWLVESYESASDDEVEEPKGIKMMRNIAHPIKNEIGSLQEYLKENIPQQKNESEVEDTNTEDDEREIHPKFAAKLNKIEKTKAEENTRAEREILRNQTIELAKMYLKGELHNFFHELIYRS